MPDLKRENLPRPRGGDVHTAVLCISLALTFLVQNDIAYGSETQSDAREISWQYVMRSDKASAIAEGLLAALADKSAMRGASSTRKGQSLYPILFGAFLGAIGVGLVFLLRHIGYGRRLAAKTKASEAKYKDLYENSPEMLISLDMQTERITRCNDTCARLTGYSKEEIIGRRVEEMCHPDCAERVRNYLSLFRQTGRIDNAELLVVRKDGEIMEVMLRSEAVRDERGNVVGSRSSWRDITERKRVEKAARAGEDKLRKLLERVSNVPIQGYKSDRTVAFWNKASEVLYGYTAEEAMGRKLEELIVPPDMREEVARQVDDWIFRGQPIMPSELGLIRKDGAVVRVFSSHAMVEDGLGTKELYCIDVDLTNLKRTEEALRESETRYRLLADNTLDIIWQMDLDLRFTYVNSAITAITGHAVDEWIGSKLPEHCDSENFAKMARIVAQELAKGPASSGIVFEAVMFKKNLEPLDVEIRGKVLFDENDKPIGLQGITRDVTARKKTEDSLRESEERHRRMVETANEGIWSLDKHSKTVFVNRRMAEMLGYSGEEMIDRPMSAFVCEDELAEHQKRESDRKQYHNDVYQRKFRRKDGGEAWMIVSTTALIDKDRAIKGSFAMLTDITEHKLAQDALQESQRRTSTLMANLPGMAYRCGNSPDWPMEFVSEGAVQITGYSPSDIINNTQISYGELIHPEDRSRVWDEAQEAIAANRPFEIEYRIHTRSGEVRWLWKKGAAVLSGSGEPDALEGFISDITAHKILQEQLREAQKMEAIGTLAGGIAHDFNNLLQIISGHAELLDMDLSDMGIYLSHVEAISMAAQRGADLVRQILTFGRKVHTKLELVNLNEEVTKAERLLCSTIPKMIEIELMLDAALRPVKADSSQIVQLLLNLALNAKDAMPEGGRLTIETVNVAPGEEGCPSGPEEVQGPCVLLRVSDTGHGMAPDVIAHVYEPFFTTKGLADGAGLGLSTVFGIVKMHKGRIVCESEVGGGASFSIYFPAAGDALPEPSEKREAARLVRGSETILLVDDELMIRDFGKKILENAGYSALLANSGRKALEIFEKRYSEISAVVLDLIMPEVGGKQCLEDLLKIDPQVKVLISTGLAVEDEVKDFLNANAKGIVNKPFETGELLSSVRRVIDET